MTPSTTLPRRLLANELDEVIASASLETHFQPIVDIHRASLMGYEALTRAPANSALHSPMVLFDVAAREGRLVELERLVTRRIARRFFELRLPGQLFLNVTADTLMAAEPRAPMLAANLASLGLEANRIVVELTETRPTLDPDALGSAIAALRKIGVLIALDDLGEGFSGLRRWVDLRPDFVKIDRHFVDGIASDPLKQRFVSSILEMAASSGTAVIAEGLETQGDLDMVKQLGVPLAQGYLLARPSPLPRTELTGALHRLLRKVDGDAGDRTVDPDVASVTAGRLARAGRTVTADATCLEILELFRSEERLYAIPVLDPQQSPVGLLRSMTVLQRGAERYFMEVHGRSSCTRLMDPNPLVFDVHASLGTMSEALSNIDDRYMVDGFVVTDEGRYVGVGRTSELVKALADLQVSTAQNANPLTRLPGNVAIDRRLAALLADGRHFTIAYCDLGRFKAFNDIYGHARGDDLIRFTARLLTEVAESTGDFVGHVGGDDFVLILTLDAWRDQLDQLCRKFDDGVARYCDVEHARAGGYVTKNRQDVEVFQGLPTVAIGVLPVAPGQFASVHQLSAALVEPRQQAKLLDARSGYFVDRRLVAN